ncbi:conjugal transfer protein TrbH [Ventosimonas gracilis]|nr:conjugal transfer protein TrbH [Ventosimonas gracilis]
MLTWLNGCAVTGNYGNFIQDEASAAQSQLAKDSAKQLEKLYPAAKTHLILQQDTPDSFGKALVASLREAGFAVQTFDQHQPKIKTAPHSPQTLLPVNPDAPLQLKLAYILDQAGEDGLYHLTLLLNHQALTRLYRLDDNRFIAAGDLVWKKE